jgi:hypothetical protein
MEKTYWGLNETEIGKIWKLIEKNKSLNNIYLLADVKFEPDDTYEFYYNKIISKYPDFIEDDLLNCDVDLAHFINEDKTYIDYYDYKKNKKSNLII